MPAQHIRTKITDTVGAVRVMSRAGLIPLPRLDRGIQSILAVRKYGPFAGPVHAHAGNDPEVVALIDDRGSLTYGDIEAQSNALVRAWQAEGITPGSVMGCMCRNHRGLVLTMLAAAKNGTKLVLMNTGFARPQLVDVATREQVKAFVYDDEFTAVAEALPEGTIRYRSWVDGDTVSQVRNLDDLMEGRDRRSVPPPSTEGGFVLLTSGTTGTPKGAPRGHTSPLASAQFLDRVPLRPGQTMLMAAPAFHGTGVSQFALALALQQTVVM
ncbi:MAG: AMP-binding protein, partial [Rhodococcus sp. (in: high G+C Gram-positive bacteria)]|uniref:AMP-binding protein n=1 Tax=Rhodococcus sp. TaxID=1831 RepID=UPI003BAE6685